MEGIMPGYDEILIKSSNNTEYIVLSKTGRDNHITSVSGSGKIDISKDAILDQEPRNVSYQGIDSNKQIVTLGVTKHALYGENGHTGTHVTFGDYYAINESTQIYIRNSTHGLTLASVSGTTGSSSTSSTPDITNPEIYNILPGVGITANAIVDSISGANKYIFAGVTEYNPNLVYGISKGDYTFEVNQSHPIAFVNVNGITYNGDGISYSGIIGNSSTLDGITYYHGNVNVSVTKYFEKASVKCLNHGYMGGENLFIYNRGYRLDKVYKSELPTAYINSVSVTNLIDNTSISDTSITANVNYYGFYIQKVHTPANTSISYEIVLVFYYKPTCVWKLNTVTYISTLSSNIDKKYILKISHIVGDEYDNLGDFYVRKPLFGTITFMKSIHQSCHTQCHQS